MKPSDEAMLPCPFCGGRGISHRVPSGWRASCTQCDCKPRPGLPPDTEAEAVTAWNTRAVIDRALSPAMDAQPTADAATVVEAIVDKWLPDMATPVLSARRVSLKAATEEALAAIRQLAPRDDVAGWQPIETAPHNKAILLGWIDWRDGAWCAAVDAATTGERFENGYSSVSHHGSATHWMPLPAPPAIERGDFRQQGEG